MHNLNIAIFVYWKSSTSLEVSGVIARSDSHFGNLSKEETLNGAIVVCSEGTSLA